MEFNEKLQELRKKKGITQEELAEALYVSRAAVSKWESGRGYPNIDSLKAVANYFSVSIDELLSTEEALDIAEEDSRQRERRIRDLVFGLLDICSLMLLFLPLFAQRGNGVIREASLLALSEVSPYIRFIYFALVVVLAVWGILTLALQNCNKRLWIQTKSKVSLVLNVLGVLLFILGLQPYAAVFLFIFLIIKVLMLVKWQ